MPEPLPPAMEESTATRSLAFALRTCSSTSVPSARIARADVSEKYRSSCGGSHAITFALGVLLAGGRSLEDPAADPGLIETAHP